MCIRDRGNTGTYAGMSPAACKGVLAVGATTPEDTRAPFSTMGVWMGVSAPGQDILSTWLRNRWVTESGTSMATPLVAGIGALMRSAHPEASVDDVIARIRSGSTDLGAPGFDEEFGQGRVDALRTLTMQDR